MIFHCNIPKCGAHEIGSARPTGWTMLTVSADSLTRYVVACGAHTSREIGDVVADILKARNDASRPVDRNTAARRARR